MTASSKHLRIGSHLLFWLFFFLFRLTSSTSSKNLVGDYWWGDLSVIHLLVVEVLCKAVFAYGMVYYLLPKFLDKKRYLLFVVSSFVWLYIVCSVFIALHYYYLEHIYTINMWPDKESMTSMPMRLSNPSFLLNLFTNFLYPATILGAIKFYKKKMMLSKIEEEKNAMELKVLKNQLNPHFLFNTLNNMYTLSLLKDDRTPMMISTLSSILDNVLYKSNQKLVPLKNETQLLQDYVKLEMLRYGEERVTVQLEVEGDQSVKIAPLVLLTLLENAFKHGVKNEIKMAKIDMSLYADDKNISFKIVNTVPNDHPENHEKREKIGLENIRKQLEIIYPDRHKIDITETSEAYQVALKIAVE